MMKKYLQYFTKLQLLAKPPNVFPRYFGQQHPEITWREMAGMRDVIIHKYDQLDLEVVWDVVEKLPKLLNLIDPLL